MSMSNDPTIPLAAAPVGPDPMSPAPVNATPAIGQRVATGFAWVGINTLANKFIGITVQLILGKLLVPEDFGIVASVLAITQIANPARLLNVSTFLSRRPAENQTWASASFWLTLCSVSFGALLLTIATPFLAARDSHPGVFAGCMALALLSNSIDVMSMPFTGVLNGRMAFGFQARVMIGLSVVQSILAITLAKLHFGPFSILVPTLLLSIARIVLYFRASNVKIHLKPETNLWKPIAIEGIWNSVAAFGFLIISQASYVGLSWFHGKYDTGLYYFAFTVAVQALFLVSSGLSAVLLPAMSQATSGDHRRSMYVTCCRMLLLITAPLCMMQTLAIEPAVRMVFGEKWVPAIVMAQLMSVGTLLRIVSFPSQSLFVAEGRLTLYAGWMMSWAAALCAVVLISSAYSSPMTLTIAVVIFYCLFDPLTGVLAFRICGLSTPKSLGMIATMHVVPIVGSLLAGVAAWYAQNAVTSLQLSMKWIWLLQLVLAMAIVPLVYMPFMALFAREESRRVRDIAVRLFLPRLPGGARLVRALGLNAS